MGRGYEISIPLTESNFAYFAASTIVAMIILFVTPAVPRRTKFGVILIVIGLTFLLLPDKPFPKIGEYRFVILSSCVAASLPFFFIEKFYTKYIKIKGTIIIILLGQASIDDLTKILAKKVINKIPSREDK